MPPRPRRRGRAPLVTLTSDLGTAYAAQMKAVLLQELPADRVVDLAHDLAPHAIAEASFVVRAIGERFPSGSIHVVVVDPGVGGRRAPVAIACRDGSVLVGPNNGVLSPLAEALGGGTAHCIDPGKLRAGPRVGTTFDGRDLFAPAAARLANGMSAASLGPPVPMAPSLAPPPRRTPWGARGTVAHVDHFGNVVTDVPTVWLPRQTRRVVVRWSGSSLRLPVVRSYEESGAGTIAALGSSFGTLELAVAEGRATDRLGLRVGEPVELRWSRETVSKRRTR